MVRQSNRDLPPVDVFCVGRRVRVLRRDGVGVYCGYAFGTITEKTDNGYYVRVDDQTDLQFVGSTDIIPAGPSHHKQRKE